MSITKCDIIYDPRLKCLGFKYLRTNLVLNKTRGIAIIMFVDETEKNLDNGRFHNFKKNYCFYKVPIIIIKKISTVAGLKSAMRTGWNYDEIIEPKVEWISTNIKLGWNFDIHAQRVENETIFSFNFCFRSKNEAALFKLVNTDEHY